LAAGDAVAGVPHGKFVLPVMGRYFDVITPITGRTFTKAARSGAEDIELALDAAHAAADNWGRTAPADRADVLLKIADRLEQNLELLAYAETVDNGKPIRETLNADLTAPLRVTTARRSTATSTSASNPGSKDSARPPARRGRPVPSMNDRGAPPSECTCCCADRRVSRPAPVRPSGDPSACRRVRRQPREQHRSQCSHATT
jgi:hypothetical protein